MDKEEDTTELIESMHKSADALEELVKTGKVPDTPPVDTLDDVLEEIKTAAYNAGIDKGYRSHKRDSFVRLLMFALAGLFSGLLVGWAI